jgi:hypothetical protein
LNVIDDSRCLVASVAKGVFKAADVVGSFHGAASLHGSPASLLTDNGAVFTAVPRKGMCAIEELRAELDRFLAYCKDVRPHRAIDRRTPSEAFHARPKAAPSLPGVPVSSHVRARRDNIDITRVITLRHNSRLHHVGLGRRLRARRRRVSSRRVRSGLRHAVACRGCRRQLTIGAQLLLAVL